MKPGSVPEVRPSANRVTATRASARAEAAHLQRIADALGISVEDLQRLGAEDARRREGAQAGV
ncbi:MAG: hypothetical protein AB7P22_06090 [Vicinamibacterales bacterium]